MFLIRFSQIKFYFLNIVYRLFKMRKILYNSEEEESIEDEQPIKKPVVIKAPKTDLSTPKTEIQAPTIPVEEIPELNIKLKPDIICVHCKKSFSRQTILNKHLNEFRCKQLRELQLQKEQEMHRKQSELNELEEKMFIQLKKKQARIEKKMIKEQGQEELQQQQNIIQEKKITKPKKEVKQKVEKVEKVNTPIKETICPVRQERAKYIISF